MAGRSMVFLTAAVVAVSVAFGFAVPSDAASGCNASASSVWKAAGRIYRSEAFSSGPSCALAVATIVVRAPDGHALWVDSAPAEHLMTLAGVKTAQQMSRALGEWLTQSHMFKSSGDLPAWQKGAEAPKSGEFPFYPEAGVDRDTYEQMRAEKQPVFCYVQGMESLSCVALSKDGQMTKVGVQTFPG